MRAPLIIPNEAREGSRTKDSWGVNCFLEREDADRAVKRPGLVNTVDVVGAGTVGQGLFIWPELNGPKIVMIWDDQLFVLEYTGADLGVDFAWDVGAASPAAGVVLSAPYALTFYNPQVNIGDQVAGYYAMVDNPSTSPGGGDPYWSATPPGTDRFRCVWNTFGSGGGGGNVIALSPTTPNYMIGDIAASADAAAKVWVENSIGANLAGIAALDDTSSYSPDVVASSYLFNTPTTYSIVSTSYVEMSVSGKNAFLSPPYPGGWPSGVDWTGPTTFNKRVGFLRKRRTTTSFTLTSSGTTATLTSGALLGPYQWIEISGCNEPEYNGIFYAVQQLNPTYPWLSALEWKFTLPGIPAASPATGTKVLTYYGVL